MGPTASAIEGVVAEVAKIIGNAAKAGFRRSPALARRIWLLAVLDYAVARLTGKEVVDWAVDKLDSAAESAKSFFPVLDWAFDAVRGEEALVTLAMMDWAGEAESVRRVARAVSTPQGRILLERAAAEWDALSTEATASERRERALQEIYHGSAPAGVPWKSWLEALADATGYTVQDILRMKGIIV